MARDGVRAVDGLDDGDAEVEGEVAIEPSGAVVNMPMLRWPGGQR